MMCVPYTRRLIIVITQHAISCSLSGNCVRVVCDETDIGDTATAYSDIADDLLAIPGISGADIVTSLHGVGKATVIKIVARKGTLSLSKVGDVKADMKSMQAQATVCDIRQGSRAVHIHDRMQGEDVAFKNREECGIIG